jgi:hypothetical protein
VGAHRPIEFSTDLLSPFIPGGHSFFREFTRPFWSRLTGNIDESSVYLGLSVVGMLMYVWARRKRIAHESLNLWFFVLLFFLILSFGPRLHVLGKQIPYAVGPYALLDKVIPLLNLSGAPVRMMAMVQFAACVLCAFAFREFFAGSKKMVCVGLALFAVLFVEYLPDAFPRTRIEVPEYVKVLARQPDEKGLFDRTDPGVQLALYYQTIHQKRLPNGYVSRVQEDLNRKSWVMIETFKREDFLVYFREAKYRYLVTDASMRYPSLRILYEDDDVILYDVTGGAE